MHRRALPLVLVLAAGLPAQDPAAPPPAPRTDMVYLLDVSGSMRKQRALQRAQEMLADIMDQIVQPGTRQALIPFGTGVQEARSFAVPSDDAGATKKRAAIRRAIEATRATDSYTYLFQAIRSGLETLRGFRDENPGHLRHILLVSDGKQLVPRGESSPTLQQIIAHFEELDFKPGEDWFIWYAHFGEPDDTLKRLLEETGAGKTFSLDDLTSLHWAVTKLDRDRIDLGRQAQGDWTADVRVTARTASHGVGKTILLRVDDGALPEGMAVDVEPREAVLSAETTEIDLKIRCTGARAGVHDRLALVVEGEEGTLHWIETPRVGLRFDVVRPRIDVGSAELAFGRLAPGMSREMTLTLVAPGDASKTRPRVRLSVAGGDGAVRLPVPEVQASARTEVVVALEVPKDAAEGERFCRVILHADDAEIVPGAIDVTWNVGWGRVAVGTDELALDRVQAGREVETVVTLVPDPETARLGLTMQCEAKVFAARGVSVAVPETVRLDGPVRVPVRVTVPVQAPGGRYDVRLRFAAPEGVKVEPADVPLALDVVEAAAVSLPALVDLGDVPASQAREIAGRMELAVGPRHAGLDLELTAAEGETTIEPRVIRLTEGTLAVPVTLRTVDVTSGAHTASFDAFVTEDGRREKVGTVAVRWRVLETYFKVQSWAGPAAVPHGDHTVTATLVVNASADLAGGRLRVAPLLDGLAPGMQVALGEAEVGIEGGMQAIPVTLKVTGARTGVYEGKLELGFASGMEGMTPPDPLPLRLSVAGTTVYVACEGGLDGMIADTERTLVLVLTASGVTQPAMLSLGLDRARLPGTVEIDMPATARVERDGVTRVPLRVRVHRNVDAGTWEPHIEIKAMTEGVAVTPESLPLRAQVSGPVTIVKEASTPLWLWLAGGGAILVLLVVAVVLLKRKPEVVHVHAAAQEPSLAGVDDLVLDEEDEDMLVLEGFDDE